MILRRGKTAGVVAAGLVATAALATAALATAGSATSPKSGEFSSVPAANPKAPGLVTPNVLPPELAEVPVAQGAARLENGTEAVPFYGYLGDGPMIPAAGAMQTPDTKIEATKTEPDKNTYLVLNGQRGADPGYDYGTHFLFQGHEGGSPGSITRINLDADGPHRVTLMATADEAGKPLPTFDGSTWDPWAQRLLLTAERGKDGGVWQATLDVPSQVRDISGALGRGGYEGIQNDSLGQLWVVEDVGGPTGTVNTKARQPNSFVYRFVPNDVTNLTKGGKLQALQVTSLRTGQPIVFHAGQADADILSDDVKDLHTYGKVFPTRWVTIHDTAVDGSEPFDANAAAKANAATPFKRPENGVFRPGSHFSEFLFDETGDTNASTQAGSEYGGFGGILRLRQASPSADTGQLSLFYRGDVSHTGLDNVSFLNARTIVFVEDAGDTLHTQRNALDSAYAFDVDADYGDPSTPPPARLLAEGRDASATLDSSIGSTPANGFQNDGDNELTGFHVSDGDPSTGGILGERFPAPFTGSDRWRVFYTQQHGDNITWEIIRPR